ncbi:hypothetical protein JOM56_000176 [Amanita muscaria]
MMNIEKSPINSESASILRRFYIYVGCVSLALISIHNLVELFPGYWTIILPTAVWTGYWAATDISTCLAGAA